MAARLKQEAPAWQEANGAFATMQTPSGDADSEVWEPQSGQPHTDAKLAAASDTGVDQGKIGAQGVTAGSAGRASALEATEIDSLPKYRPLGGRGSPLDRSEALVLGTGSDQVRRDGLKSKAGAAEGGTPIKEPVGALSRSVTMRTTGKSTRVAQDASSIPSKLKGDHNGALKQHTRLGIVEELGVPRSS